MQQDQHLGSPAAGDSPANAESGSAPARSDQGRIREVALLFLRLGFTAFGGPAAHVAMMEDEVVTRRKWIDRRHFLDLVGALNFIPGPNSTELAIHLGHLRAGRRGLAAAGACFIAPAVLIILPLAWAYVRFGKTPSVVGMLSGVSAAVVAILFVAGWRFAGAAVTDRFTAVVAVASLAASLGMDRLRLPWGVQPELVVLAAAGVAGVAWRRGGSLASPGLVPLLAGPVLGVASAGARDGESGWLQLARMGLFFLKVGATLFGTGYVLVSYLRSGLVQSPDGWITERQLLDAVAVGQLTPGPLLTTATFIGYVCGHRFFGGSVGGAVLGALAATIGIFLPSFLLVAGFGRILPRLRKNVYARAALDGINAAVVAMVFTVALQFAWNLRRDPLLLALAGACLGVLLRWRINSTWLILAAGAIGVARWRLGG